MPKAIDTEKLEDPSMKILDINEPPTKTIAHQEFPKMVYLHPKDKAKEHLTKIVHGPDELEAAEKQGFKRKPHIQQEPVEDLSGEFETAYETKVGKKQVPDLPKVYYAREGKEPKVLTPSTQKELDALLRIGWKRMDS